MRALFLLWVAAVCACRTAPVKPVTTAAPSASNGAALENAVETGCRYVYENKPGAYEVLVVGDRVVWIDDTLDTIYIEAVGGGPLTTLKASEDLSVHAAIVVNDDIAVTNAESDSIQRISLRDGKVTTVFKGIHHPYELAFAGGKYFIGAEDSLYGFDPATKDLYELHDGSTWHLAVIGDTVYAAVEDELIAIDARDDKSRVLVKKLADIDHSDVDPAALAATERGPVWSSADGALWLFDMSTRRPEKLAVLKESAVQILPVGADLYAAAGNDVVRLRDGHADLLPLDKSRWVNADESHTFIIAIGVHGNALVYHSPYTAFATTCLD